MNTQQMQDKIKNLEARIKDLEDEVKALRLGERPPQKVDVGADRLRYMGPEGEMVSFGGVSTDPPFRPPMRSEAHAVDEYRDFGPIMP